MSISIHALSKSYNGMPVFQKVDLELEEGGIYCLLAPSGAGKTTLFRILMGLEQADKGEIKGIPRGPIAAVFQEDRLCESFSAFTNVKIVSDRLADQTIIAHLKQVGLGEAVNQKVSTLSGGQKRRVALVRAILAEKDVIFLDEPFKGLDEDTKKIVTDYLLSNTADTTVIMVTHDIDEAESLGAKVLNLKDGKITF